MKYDIFGFKQVKLLEFGLDAKDALILLQIKESLALDDSILEDGVIYNYVNFSEVLRCIPIVGSMRNFQSKLKKYRELEIIKTILKKEEGNLCYIRFTDKFKELEV